MNYKKMTRIPAHLAETIFKEELEDCRVQDEAQVVCEVIFLCDLDFYPGVSEEDFYGEVVFPAEAEALDSWGYPEVEVENEANSKHRGRAWRRMQERRFKAHLSHKAEVAMSKNGALSRDCWYKSSKQDQYLRHRHKAKAAKGNRAHKGSQLYKVAEILKRASKMKLVEANIA